MVSRTYLENPQRSFDFYPGVHFAISNASLLKVNRDFLDAVAQLLRYIAHFHLEYISGRMNPLQIEPLKGSRLPACKTSCGVLGLCPQDDPHPYPIGPPAEQTTVPAPAFVKTAAFYIAGTDHHIKIWDQGKHLRDIAG